MTGGVFIVFEGGDGVGKTTQVELLCRWLTEQGEAVVRTFEPGDTAVGRLIRRLVLDPETVDLAPRTEALLYAADKAQHLAEVVRPALAEGAVVVCDRYVDSMVAYQGAGRVLESAEVTRVATWATEGLQPDLTVVLDTDPGQAVSVKARKDRLESAGVEFHARVRQQFLDRAATDPGAYLVLPARDSVDSIAARIHDRIQPFLAARAVKLSVPSGTVV